MSKDGPTSHNSTLKLPQVARAQGGDTHPLGRLEYRHNDRLAWLTSIYLSINYIGGSPEA
jgi:hypothetical protein